MKRFFAILLITATPTILLGNNRNARKAYIDKFSFIAVAQMTSHNIPASITLAQGILESGSGNSFLAKSSNNHFGIKCGSQWKGKTSFHDDDKENECFRAYDRVHDSYLDHSLFLSKNKRYALLFELDLEDYKNWARGLSKAGYATSPTYASRLIHLIEDEKLYRFDHEHREQVEATPTLSLESNNTFSINQLNVVSTKNGDTFYKISRRTGVTLRQLHKYNKALAGNESLKTNTPVYLQRKKNKSKKGFIVLDASTTLAQISQKEGIRIKALMKLNLILTPNMLLHKGEKVFLR